jgi:hypothetical protein
MKKFLVCLFIVLTVAFFATSGFAADVPTTWGWEDSNATGTIASWNLYSGPSAAGPWTLEKNQPFYDKGAETLYKTSDAVTVANNAQTTVWFKANTVGTNGLTSVDSNIISFTYDTRVTPVAPVIINITTP